MEIRLPEIHSEGELIDLVREVGFLPFFQNEISGFSIEDCTPPDLWFSDTQDGPWEWKGPAARSKTCIYGKLFTRKAGFVSREWMPHFCNLRRNGYDFDVLFEEQGASYQDKRIYETLREHRAMETGPLKSLLNYRKGGNKGFDTSITRLQMQTYVVIGDFVYHLDKNFRQYGWGTSLYTTPEVIFGYDEVTSAYDAEPEESRALILAHLKKLLPQTEDKKLKKLLKG